LTEKPRKIFIGGVPQFTTKEELYAYFEEYGEIEDLNLTFKRENKGKGFGFLLFKDGDSMKKVLDDFNYHSINGSWFECQIAKPKFSENCNGNEAELSIENTVPRKQSDNTSQISKISNLRDQLNKNLQQNLSNLNTSCQTSEKKSKLDISTNKSEDKELKVEFNFEENLLLEKIVSGSENATDLKKPTNRSFNTLKMKRGLARLNKIEQQTKDDWGWSHFGGANINPQFANVQLVSNQKSSFANYSTQNTVSNYINQQNANYFVSENSSNFSLKQINAVQAPPGLEPVPRRTSFMSSELYDSLKKQQMIYNELAQNNEKMPFEQMQKEIFYNQVEKNQVDKESLKIFCYDDSEKSTRIGSEISLSENEPRDYKLFDLGVRDYKLNLNKE